MSEDDEITPADGADHKPAVTQDGRADQEHEEGVRRQRQHIKDMTGQDPLSSIDD
ncbi:hypothetical protein [Caulobacter sp. NIBR2454]|uniref:hypothetical protein n=1 Tax=Caulobacter sp. NIBR2454 TaxID=3015996 RepID=UPI0022B6F15D|nr:hypothetical protein [Caulobacter sp. NIBR2454]